MLTKQEVVDLLQSSDEIMDYQKFKSDMSTGKLYPISQEDVVRIIIRWADAYEKIIRHVLHELDESSS